MSKAIKSKSERNKVSSNFRDSKQESENKIKESALKGTSYEAEYENATRKNTSEPKNTDNGKRTVLEGKKADNESSWQFIFLMVTMGIAILFMILKIIGIV